MKKVLLIFCFLSFSILADDSLIQIKQKLEKIERDVSDIQKNVFTKKDINKSSNNQNTDSTITVFDMRLRDIESELKSVNLNYENISFEIEDIKSKLEELSLEIENALITINTRMNNDVSNVSEVSDDNLLNSNNLETLEQSDEENSTSSLKISSNDSSEFNNDLENDENKVVYSSPEEQFQAAFDNLKSQKFQDATTDLKKFIDDYPTNKLAGSAHYWLGEIYLLKKEYREAALIFAEGYQKYPDSVKSPDSLYKLAETLVKINKIEEACNTLKQFELKYSTNKLIEKTKSKILDLQCI